MRITINTPHNRQLVQRFARVLEDYKKESHKSWPVILKKEAEESARVFSKELGGGKDNLASRHSRASMISGSALARGYRMGRRGNSMTRSSSGISKAAWGMANRLMHGQPSEYFKVDAIGNISLVRVDKRRRANVLISRKTKTNPFKYGRSALELSKEQRATSFSTLGGYVKRLNTRAVATHFELMLRQRAARGGTVSVQWLPKLWKRIPASQGGGKYLVSSNRRGFPLSQVKWGAGWLSSGLAMISNVPGTSSQIEKHGIIPKLFNSRIQDRINGIKIYQAKAMERAARMNGAHVHN